MMPLFYNFIGQYTEWCVVEQQNEIRLVVEIIFSGSGHIFRLQENEFRSKIGVKFF